MTTPAHFKQRLAEELTARAAALPPTPAVPLRARHTRRIAVTALGLAAAATAVMLIPHDARTTATPQAGADPSTALAPGSGAPVLSNASYTVTPRKDGTVAVLVTGVEFFGLQTALRSVGVPAVVLRVSKSCPAKVRTDNANLEKVSMEDPKNGRLMVIRPSAIPHGDSLVLVQADLKGNQRPTIMGSMEVLLAQGEPNCFPASQSNVIGEG